MDLRIEQFLAKSTTITVFTDVDTPSPGFSTTTASPSKEELGPGWAMDDVYPPLAELRQALLTDEEWSAMSSWDKDVWEMFYRPDWERLACIEQILVDTLEAQRAHRHEEILEALRNLEASASKSASATVANACIDVYTYASPPDTNLTVAIGFEGLVAPTPARCSMEGSSHDFTELRSASAPAMAPTTLTTTTDIISAVSATTASDGNLDVQAIGDIGVTPTTCSTVCLPRHPVAASVLVVSSPLTPTEIVLDTNNFHVAAVPLAVQNVLPAVSALSSSQHITSKVPVHRPMAWPSFLDVHANREEIQPLPWPSFTVFFNCESPSDAVMKPSRRCTSGHSPAIICDIIEFQNLALSASRKAVDDMFIWALSESNLVKLFAATHVQSMEKNLKVTSPIAYFKLLRWSNYLLKWTQSATVSKCGFSRMNNTRAALSQVLMDGSFRQGRTCKQLSYPAVRSNTSDDFHCGGEEHDEESEGSGELIQWLISNLFYDCFLSNLYGSDISSINRLYQTGKVVFQVATTLKIYEAMLELQLTSSGNSSVCFHELQSTRNETKGTASRTNMHSCQLKCDEAIFAYLVCCPSFSSASKGSVWEAKKLELTNWVSYTVAQYNIQCSIGTGFHSFGESTSRALVQGISHSRNNNYPIHGACFPSSKCDSFYSNENEFYTAAGVLVPLQSQGGIPSLCDGMTCRCGLSQNQDSMHSLADTENRTYADHAYLSYGFVLMCWLAEQMLPTWPPPIAYCSITSSMFRDLDLSIVAMCEVWLLNHQDMMQMLIVWSPRIHAGFITRELSNEDDTSCCFLCWHHGMPTLSLFLALDKQGERCAMIPIIRYLAHDSYSDFVHSLYSNGLKNQNGDNGVATKKQSNLVVRTDVPWNPGGSIWYWWFSTVFDQDPFQGGRHVIAVTTFFEQFSASYNYYLDYSDIRASASYQLSAYFDWVPIDHDFYFYLVAVYPNSGYYCDSETIKDRRLQWDPGKWTQMSAWGQAEFQGGRGVRNPS